MQVSNKWYSPNIDRSVLKELKKRSDEKFESDFFKNVKGRKNKNVN